MKLPWITNFDKDKNGRLTYIKKRMNYRKFNVSLLAETRRTPGNKRASDSREVQCFWYCTGICCQGISFWQRIINDLRDYRHNLSSKGGHFSKIIFKLRNWQSIYILYLGNSCKFVQFLLSRNWDSTHLFGSNERVPAALHGQTFAIVFGRVILCMKSSCGIF